MTYALVSLFSSAFLSATLVPGTSEVLLASLLAKGNTAPAFTILVATIGNTLGSSVNWGIGRFMLRFRDRRWFPVKPDKFERYASWYRRYGTWSLLFSWAPVIGDPLTLIAGVARTPISLFIVIVFLAKGGRYLFVAGMTGLLLP